MELPTKLLEQIAYNTRPKIEEHILIVMNKSIHEENLSVPLQINNRQFKIAVTFHACYNALFNITDKNNKFYFFKSISDGNHTEISIKKGIYEIEALNDEIERVIINKGYYTDEDYPFYIKPDFETLGSIIEISAPGAVISFLPDDSIGQVLGFGNQTIYEEYNISPNPVTIISFDNIFLETDIADAMIFRGKRTGIIFNWQFDVNPGYKYIHKFRGGIQWYMLRNTDLISSISFKLKNENKELVSLNGQTVTFRISIKEI